MMNIKLISYENKDDINIPNESFELVGKMEPTYFNGVWDYYVIKNDMVEFDIFPDENYNFNEMKDDYIFIGAYDSDKCVGLAILKKQWNKYIYLHDLKVNKDYRGQKIGTKLIEKSKQCAFDLGYNGIWTVGQNNNLAACLFYIKNGFRIGGLDTEVYNGTKLSGVSDIYFYLDLNK